MLISLCLPVHNRTYDLKKTMPRLLEAVNGSPPAEIVVLDYNSGDDLREYITGYSVTYRRYAERNHYHMAHARNLSLLSAAGEWCVVLSADIWITPDYLPFLRSVLVDDAFYYDQKYKGVIAVRRDEFIAAGGYDERFEFYGSEDRELHERLVRRGNMAVSLFDMVRVIPTPNEVKVQGYRLPLTKQEMHEAGLPVLLESRETGRLVANPDGWGRWT